MDLHGEIVEITENELTEICIVRVNIYDEDMTREGMNNDDKYIHLITQTSFSCNKDEIEDRVKDIVWEVWFNHAGSVKNRDDLVNNKSFKIDENTGEMNG